MMTFTTKSDVKPLITKEVQLFLTEELGSYLVVRNGVIIAKHLSNAFDNVAIYDGLTITEKQTIITEFSRLQPSLDAIEFTSGLLIYVPKNLIVSETLHVFYLTDEPKHIHNTMIYLESNSQLKYFEYLTNNEVSDVTFISQSNVSENANLNYSGITKYNDQADVHIHRYSNVLRYGKSVYSVAEVNDATTTSNTSIYLLEQYASGTSKTVAITSLKQDASFKQLIEHLAPDTEGYIENYGVANNDSKLVFEGVGKINKLMKRSIARQSNRGIILGVEARLDANPLLLIDEYDVEASHGAAIGKIDEEQLYYLMSRGITLKNAERLIISGFLSPVLTLLTTEELVHDFVTTVENKTL